MLRRLVSVLIILAGAGCAGDAPTGAARVVMKWSGFAPGCVKLAAWDRAVGEASGERLQLARDDGARQGELVFAVYRRSDWAPDVTIQAEALEGTCDEGGVVARAEATVTLTDAIVETTLTLLASDADEDGFVAAAAGFSGTDCDDADATIHPGTPEICDDRDQDCDGSIDEDVGPPWFPDGDGDGHGDGTAPRLACRAPAGFVAEGDDCDDGHSEVAPGAKEACDGLDNDCNGAVDDGFEAKVWFHDADKDGFGSKTTFQLACAAPPEYVDNDDDCDDAASTVNPKATELCNGIDDNCNEKIDDDAGVTWYRDADGDSYGVKTDTRFVCTAPAGYVDRAGDCDDGRDTVFPGGTEVCNGFDDDCNTLVDDGLLTHTLHRDADGDGQGDANTPVQACGPRDGVVANTDDCDDGNPFRTRNGIEHCDSIDNNCDQRVDEGLSCAGATWATPSGINGGGADWRSVSAWEAGKAWSAGRGAKLRQFDGNSSTSRDGACSGDLDASWADKDGTLYLAGKDGLARHPLGGNCSSPLQTSSNGLRGIVGFSDPGGPTLYAVGTDGRIIRWDSWLPAASALREEARFTGTELWDVGGASPGSVIAVGAQTSGVKPLPVVIRWVNGTFQPDTLPTTLPSGHLRKISVARPDVAFAVGDSGMLVRWDGTAWSALPAISDALELLAVKAFGANLVYVAGSTTAGHSLWRWDGVSWTSVTTLGGDAPRDLDGNSPWDLWVVGDRNLVRHYSE